MESRSSPKKHQSQRVIDRDVVTQGVKRQNDAHGVETCVPVETSVTVETSVQNDPVQAESTPVVSESHHDTKRHKHRSVETSSNPSKEEVVSGSQPMSVEVSSAVSTISTVNITHDLATSAPLAKETKADQITRYPHVYRVNAADPINLKEIDDLIAVPNQDQTKTKGNVNAVAALMKFARYQTVQHIKLVKINGMYYLNQISDWIEDKVSTTDSIAKMFTTSYVIVDTVVNGQRQLELRMGIAHHFLALDEEKVRELLQKHKLDPDSLSELEKAKAANTDAAIKYPTNININSVAQFYGCKDTVLAALQTSAYVCKVVSAGDIVIDSERKQFVVTPQSGTFYNEHLGYSTKANQVALYSRLRAHDFFPMFHGNNVIIYNTYAEAKHHGQVPLTFSDYQAFKLYIASNNIPHHFVSYRAYIEYVISLRATAKAEARLNSLANKSPTKIANLSSTSSEEKTLGVSVSIHNISDKVSMPDKEVTQVHVVNSGSSPETQRRRKEIAITQHSTRNVSMELETIVVSQTGLFKPLATATVTASSVPSVTPPKNASPDRKKHPDVETKDSPSKLEGDVDNNVTNSQPSMS